MNSPSKNFTLIKNLFDLADIQINGNHPWDIQVKNENLYSRLLKNPSLNLGESYMAGWWDVQQLDKFFSKLLKANLDQKIRKSPQLLWQLGLNIIFNYQNKRHAFEVGEKHYDLGNNLYSAMLDSRKVYTCGYWKKATNLEEAQEAKLDLVCQKLNLKPGQKILDIGCGWGSFAKFAAERYGVEVVGITVSKEQAKLAQELCLGLPVKILLKDYRDLNEKFDHIVSLGMFEHVGPKNYRNFMQIVRRSLKDNGLFLLHTIGHDYSTTSLDPWIEKYIFPNGMLPSLKQIATATEKLFIIEDWHTFGADYDKTLMAWFKNFDQNWGKIKAQYGERFYRMWKYYLLSCAGSFRSRNNNLWQIVLSKEGVPGGYKSIR